MIGYVLGALVAELVAGWLRVADRFGLLWLLDLLGDPYGGER